MIRKVNCKSPVLLHFVEACEKNFSNETPWRSQRRGQLLVVDFAFVRFQMPHNDDGLLDTPLRAFGLTDNVQQSPLFPPRESMK